MKQYKINDFLSKIVQIYAALMVSIFLFYFHDGYFDITASKYQCFLFLTYGTLCILFISCLCLKQKICFSIFYPKSICDWSIYILCACHVITTICSPYPYESIWAFCRRPPHSPIPSLRTPHLHDGGHGHGSRSCIPLHARDHGGGHVRAPHSHSPRRARDHGGGHARAPHSRIPRRAHGRDDDAHAPRSRIPRRAHGRDDDAHVPRSRIPRRAHGRDDDAHVPRSHSPRHTHGHDGDALSLPA